MLVLERFVGGVGGAQVGKVRERGAAMRASFASELDWPSCMSAVWSKSISADVNFWKMEARSSLERFSTAFVNIQRPSVSACFF